MKAVAFHSTSDSGPAGKHQTAKVPTVPVSPWCTQPASALDGPVIQRKSACACGGDCPRCVKKSGSPKIQTKLAVSTPGDEFEQEADRVAQQVMRMPRASTERETSIAARPSPPAIQRQLSTVSDGAQQLSSLYEREPEEGEAEEPLQAKEIAGKTPRGGLDVASRVSALRGGGEPLPDSSRAFFEPRLGYDFGHVRVHADASAAETAREVRALAFTVGSDVVFGERQYEPDSDRGRALLAHELVHVIQQQGNRAGPTHTWPADFARAPNEPAPFIQRQGDATGENEADDGAEAPAARALTRPEEIEQSRTSQGEITGRQRPPLLSLFNYAIAEATPKERHVAAIAEVADMIRHAPAGLVRIVAVGHSDAFGEPGVNNPLSRRRAERVRSRLGASLAGTTVEVSWQGENDPATTNDTVEGRGRNRRVDLHFLPRRAFQIAPAVQTPTPGGGVPPPITETPRTEAPPPAGERPPPTEQPPTGTDQPPTGTHRPPPTVEPPPTDDGTDIFCVDHPIICAAFGIGVLGGLGAILAPLSGLLACLLNPVACIVGPSLPGLPPGGDGPPDNNEPPEDEEDQGPPVVRFEHVSAENTPDGMRDRIPPRIITPVAVSVSNWRPGTPPILIRVGGASAELGSLTINGDITAEITDSTVLDLIGVFQSRPGGRGGALRLEATQGNRPLASSNFFAVAAIPQDVLVVFDSPIQTPAALGALTMNHWVSDSGSGQLADLDNIRIQEHVEEKERSGTFADRPSTEFQRGNVSGTSSPRPDRHTTPIGELTDVGRSVNTQVFVFEDRRTGSSGIPLRNSAFQLVREVIQDSARTPARRSAPCLKFVYMQLAQAGNAFNFQSEAGETSPDPIVVPFDLPCVEAGSESDEPAPSVPPGGGGISPPPGGPPGGRRMPPRGGRGGTGQGGSGRGGGAGIGSGSATVVTPRPIRGQFSPSNVTLSYVSGLPPQPVADGTVQNVVTSFQVQGRSFVVRVPYVVESVTTERVMLRSQNNENWNLVPDDLPPVILPARSPASLPLEILRRP